MEKILRKFCLMSAASLALVGCSNEGDTESAEGGDTSPETLQVQFVPTNNDGSMEAMAEPFQDYLSEKLDREVNVTLATDFSTIVQAMGSGQVDLGIMPPAAYVQARDMGAAEAVLSSELEAYDRETGEPLEGETTPSFKGEVLVKANSDLQNLEDLAGANIATLSPSSAAGYIYPVAEMNEAGIDLSGITFTTVNDIPSQLTAVLNGQQDAAFVFEGARYVFQDAVGDNDLVEDLRVLYLTEGDIPNDAIAVQPDMDQDLKDQIAEAFRQMPEDETSQEVMGLWGHQDYTEPDEEAYDTLNQYTELAAD